MKLTVSTSMESTHPYTHTRPRVASNEMDLGGGRAEADRGDWVDNLGSEEEVFEGWEGWVVFLDNEGMDEGIEEGIARVEGWTDDTSLWSTITASSSSTLLPLSLS